MTFLLYDLYELEEKSSRHLKRWKAWHLVLYALAAIFGIMNYVCLRNTMALVDDNCLLYPRLLEFRMTNLTDIVDSQNDADTIHGTTDAETLKKSSDNNAQSKTSPEPNALDKADGETASSTSSTTDGNTSADVGNVTSVDAQFNSNAVRNDTVVANAQLAKRETIDLDVLQATNKVTQSNESLIAGNLTHQLVLDTSRTLFSESCEFAEYMPIMSTVFGVVWVTMFTMCAGGGRTTSGLPQPWRILAPALLFAVVMVGLTGHSFILTNGGLQAFCADFSNVTNTTACSSVQQYLEKGRNSAWSMGARISATRAASAGVWISWACATALLLIRCLAAPDFKVKKTGAYLVRDPHQKVIPHLKKQRRPQRSNVSSPSKRDTVSMRSEPTITTELVTASIEPGQNSLPSSLTTTPLRAPRNQEIIEMTYSPQERNC